MCVCVCDNVCGAYISEARYQLLVQASQNQASHSNLENSYSHNTDHLLLTHANTYTMLLPQMEIVYICMHR